MIEYVSKIFKLGK